jgi:hypothetical protein
VTIADSLGQRRPEKRPVAERALVVAGKENRSATAALLE